MPGGRRGPRNREAQTLRDDEMADQPLLATVTGEHFQPVRLHYKVLNRPGLLREFEKLRCLDYDSSRKRWVWLYDHEARELRFPQSYAQIAKELHPIVIGSFFMRSEVTLLLDLRSCERALLAIPFFDAHLSRRLVEIEEAEVVNRLFPATKANLRLSPDALFDRQIATVDDPEALIRQLVEKTADVRNKAERIKIVLQDLRSRSKQTLPEIERIPVHFAEDGIGGFKMALQLRQMVAMQHWLGHTKYTMDDAIQSTLPSL
jgi:curved DNA-binding protein CbpA